VVCLPDLDGSVLAALAEAGCTAVSRAGRARLSFHLWNDGEDVDRVVDALGRARAVLTPA
jgi:selenocysteine lyase/cysteine desulfurase